MQICHEIGNQTKTTIERYPCYFERFCAMLDPIPISCDPWFTCIDYREEETESFSSTFLPSFTGIPLARYSLKTASILPVF